MIVAETAIEMPRKRMPPRNEPVRPLDLAEDVRAEEPAEVAHRVDQADAPGGGGLGQEQAGQATRRPAGTPSGPVMATMNRATVSQSGGAAISSGGQQGRRAACRSAPPRAAGARRSGRSSSRRRAGRPATRSAAGSPARSGWSSFRLYQLLEDARQEELDAVVARHDEEVGGGQDRTLGLARASITRHVLAGCRAPPSRASAPAPGPRARRARARRPAPGRSVRKNRTSTPRTTAGMPQAM